MAGGQKVILWNMIATSLKTSCFLCFPQRPISLSIWINIFTSFTSLEAEGLLRKCEVWWSIMSDIIYNSAEFAAARPFSNQPARKFFWQLLHLHHCNRWCWNQVRCSLDVGGGKRIWLGLSFITCYSLGEVIRFTNSIPTVHNILSLIASANR